MPEPSAQIAVFAKIPDDKIRALADALDESIVCKPGTEKIREVAGAHLSESDAASVATVFYNFFVSQDDPQPIMRMVDAAPLEDQKKEVLVRVLKSIHKKSSAQKVLQMMSAAELDDAGRYSLRQLRVYTETRPVSDNCEIAKMAPKLVIRGILHEPNTNCDRPVFMQMDSAEGRDLAEQISERLKVGRRWAFPDTGRSATILPIREDFASYVTHQICIDVDVDRAGSEIFRDRRL